MVITTAVVHVDDVFAVGQKERYDRLCVNLNRTTLAKKLCKLKWYGGCRYSRDRERGTLTISQQSFAEELANKFRVTSVQSVPLKVELSWRSSMTTRTLRVGRFVNLLVV